MPPPLVEVVYDSSSLPVCQSVCLSSPEFAGEGESSYSMSILERTSIDSLHLDACTSSSTNCLLHFLLLYFFFLSPCFILLPACSFVFLLCLRLSLTRFIFFCFILARSSLVPPALGLVLTLVFGCYCCLVWLCSFHRLIQGLVPLALLCSFSIDISHHHQHNN